MTISILTSRYLIMEICTDLWLGGNLIARQFVLNYLTVRELTNPQARLIPLVQNRRHPNISSEISDILSEIPNISSEIPNFSSEISDERWYHHLGWSLDLNRFPIHQQSTAVEEDALHHNKNPFVSTSSRKQLIGPSNHDLVSPFVCRSKFEEKNLFVKY